MPAWIAVDAHLEDHPKFPSFCHASGLKPSEGVHCLIRLWSLVRRRGADGMLTGFTDLTLDQTLGYPKATESLISSGYIARHLATNGYTILGWREWNGQWLTDAARKRKERKKKWDRDRPRTVLGQSMPVRMEQEHRAGEYFADAGSPSGADSLNLSRESGSPSVGSSAEILAPVDTAAIVAGLSENLTIPKGKYDPRQRLWQTAQAHANPRAPSDKLMAVLSWLWFTKGVKDWGVLDRVTKHISQATNPYAMLQPGGKALEALIGDVAVGRAEVAQKAIQEDDRRMGIGR